MSYIFSDFLFLHAYILYTIKMKGLAGLFCGVMSRAGVINAKRSSFCYSVRARLKKSSFCYSVRARLKKSSFCYSVRESEPRFATLLPQHQMWQIKRKRGILSHSKCLTPTFLHGFAALFPRISNIEHKIVRESEPRIVASLPRHQTRQSERMRGILSTWNRQCLTPTLPIPKGARACASSKKKKE